MPVQVIERDGEPEYAVVPWAEYQALLKAAGQPLVEAGRNQASVQPQALANLKQLSALREAKGLSVEQLARTVGISPHYLNMIESAERVPDAAIQRALAWHLGVAGWEPQP
ncbi:multiprotein-bridging factor 1 family protein [Pseudomonas sp. 5P_3.1_Bac2]|uniref:helix-turn-helix domain-containing protein n=1 Tax=Pseudomonas sp. 5P_3.1_Bac2 TaxID=2971617 RepID=UPI0021C63F11|nr:helix-turn-helix transcriptional regulator [Pseudomonas sp. 5P_3.1_Bac2]MCU1716880.1 helix-turn-helix domain-containing protein [Pseudomonas sp. 5P_3.1_Bac2]